MSYTEFENWRSNLVEVQVNKPHEHAHHNHGKQLPDLTAEQILLVQLEMKAQLESIKSSMYSNKE